MGALRRTFIYGCVVGGLALLQYIAGRIILPEMGLEAPGYWPWFLVSGMLEVPLLIFPFLAWEMTRGSGRYIR